MKKLLLIVSLVITGMVANAQEFDKKWYVGGKFNYSSENYESNIKAFTIDPSVGFFVNPKTAVGIALRYGNYKIERKDNDYLDNTNSYGFMPTVRRYWDISDRFRFFGQASLPITFAKTESTQSYQDVIDRTTSKSKSLALEITPGISYRINKWLSAELSYDLASVSYSKASTEAFSGTNPRVIPDRESFRFNFSTDKFFGGFDVGFLIHF